MFWRMAGISAASPVETILDKENCTLEELLDEDEIIQECKALNGRLINFLRERGKVKQLIQYIVDEPPEDAEKQRTFKFPFIACEIFTCEVDIILKTLVDDDELMAWLFSYLDPERHHSTLLAGYFSKVVVCLLLRKTTSLMKYIQAHQDIISRLVDLIGITSIMEVLIRLIGADEHIYANYADTVQWLEDMDVLEMIVDKFSSSDCPEVHANAAEALCAITQCSPPAITSKISSPSFVRRLFRHSLEESRPKSVLVNLLSVCISLLDPKRLTSGTYYMYTRQMNHASENAANPETIEAMLESLGDLLRLLDISSQDQVLLTTYGKLQPPLGKRRLKIIEFMSVLVGVSNESGKKEIINLGAVKLIIELFFEYPYNNFLHHHVEHILISYLESKNSLFIEHILRDCDLIGRILEADKNFTLAVDTCKTTLPAEGRSPPRIGNIGHLTRIANKIIHLGNNFGIIQTILQENAAWIDWQTGVLLERNALENVSQWACGRPSALHDRTRDSDDDSIQDKDFDVAALASNLSEAFRFGIYNNDGTDEARDSLERDDEDVYFDDESAEVVISSLRFGDDRDSGSLFTNSNWFAFEDERKVDEPSGPTVSSSPNIEGIEVVGEKDDDDLVDTATSEQKKSRHTSDDNVPSELSEDMSESETCSSDKTQEESVELMRGNGNSTEATPTSDMSIAAGQNSLLVNGELHGELESEPDSTPPGNDNGVSPDPEHIDSTPQGNQNSEKEGSSGPAAAESEKN